MAEARMVSSIQLTLSQDEADQLAAVVVDPHPISVWGALEDVTNVGAYDAYIDQNAVRMKKEDA